MKKILLTILLLTFNFVLSTELFAQIDLKPGPLPLNISRDTADAGGTLAATKSTTGQIVSILITNIGSGSGIPPVNSFVLTVNDPLITASTVITGLNLLATTDPANITSVITLAHAPPTAGQLIIYGYNSTISGYTGDLAIEFQINNN